MEHYSAVCTLAQIELGQGVFDLEFLLDLRDCRSQVKSELKNLSGRHVRVKEVVLSEICSESLEFFCRFNLDAIKRELSSHSASVRLDFVSQHI
jgi:hypothetical protein